jgi:hypothetical protein
LFSEGRVGCIFHGKGLHLDWAQTGALTTTRDMAKAVSTILGVAFLLLGLMGFVASSFLWMHLSVAHNIIHLASGAAALYFGLRGTLSAARNFAIVFGVAYLLLAATGFYFGNTGTDTLPPDVAAGALDSHMFRIIPGVLELGTMDHVLHLLIGGLFLVGGLLTTTDSDETI